MVVCVCARRGRESSRGGGDGKAKTNVTIYGIVGATCTCSNNEAAAANSCYLAACSLISCDFFLLLAGNPYKQNMLTKHEKHKN